VIAIIVIRKKLVQIVSIWKNLKIKKSTVGKMEFKTALIENKGGD
jgi:hypothetical protein